MCGSLTVSGSWTPVGLAGDAVNMPLDTKLIRTTFQFGWADNFANDDEDNDDWANKFARAGHLFDEWLEGAKEEL